MHLGDRSRLYERHDGRIARGRRQDSASFEYNVAVTKEVVAYAHARGVTVEGELGTLGGIEDGHGSGKCT